MVIKAIPGLSQLNEPIGEESPRDSIEEREDVDDGDEAHQIWNLDGGGIDPPGPAYCLEDVGPLDWLLRRESAG